MTADVIRMQTARCPLTMRNGDTGERVEFDCITFRRARGWIRATDSNGKEVFRARVPEGMEPWPE